MRTEHISPRIEFSEANPKVYLLTLEMSKYLKECSLDPLLVELVKIRASQINGCAFCLDMHTRDARKLGVTENRIFLLSAWREAPFYSDPERLALELTEAVTLISENRLTEDLYRRVREQFPAEQYVDLLMTINVINSWNRFMIGMGHTPPSHPPQG